MADLTKDRLADSHSIARASRYASPASGSDALPIVYGDLTVPARTEAGVYTLPRIDTAGAGTYCIAAHEIAGSAVLFDDDGAIGAGDYTLNLANDFQGKGVIATAVFSAAPSGSVTAVCKGKKNASGTLIENPAEVAEDLALGHWGFTDQEIDRQALGRAVASAAAQGYAAAGVISDDHEPADVLTDLLGNFLGRFEVDAFGRLKIGIAGAEAGVMHPAMALPELEAAQMEAEISRDSVINQAPALYARDYAAGKFLEHDDGEATKGGASQALYGERTPPNGRLELAWVRSAQVVRGVQARIVERFGEPARILQIRDSTFRALALEPDDYVVFSAPWLRTPALEPLRNQIGQVISAAPDLREQTMELSLRDTGRFLTTACAAGGICAGLGRKAVGAVEFDGASGDITIADDASIQNIFDGGGSVECMIYARSDSLGNYAITKGNWRIFIVTNDNKLRFKQVTSGIDGDWDMPDDSIPFNQWIHVVMTYDSDSESNDPIFYVDGTVVTATETATPTGTRTSDAGSNVLIGNFTSSAPWDGFIDEVRFYSRVLAAAEVLEHFGGIYTDESGLAGYWPLNDGTGTLARDASVNLNHGTLNGNAAWAGAQAAGQGPNDAAYADDSVLAGGKRDTAVYA